MEKIWMVQLLKMCRFCCQNKGWYDIFEDSFNQTQFPGIKISDKCQDSLRNTGIKIEENDNLPSSICPDCLRDLTSVPSLFKVKAIHAYKILKIIRKPENHATKATRGITINSSKDKPKQARICPDILQKSMKRINLTDNINSNTPTSPVRNKNYLVKQLTNYLRRPNVEIEILSGTARIIKNVY